LKIPQIEYSFEEFLNTLCKAEIISKKRLKLAGFLTNFRLWDEPEHTYDLTRIFLNRKVEIKKLGDIRWLRGHYWDSILNTFIPAVFYAYLDSETGLLLIFTDDKMDAIREIIWRRIVEVIDGIYYLFISPEEFDKLSNKIYQDYPLSRCIRFNAMHTSQFRYRGETRPQIRRTIIYNGEDALEALDEMKHFYGVIPTLMQFKIPDLGTYSIRNNGCFTLVGSERQEESRRYLLSLANFVYKDVLVYRDIIKTADFELIPIQTERKTFHIPKLTPITINFSQKLEFNDGKALLEVLSEQGYSVFNYIISEGSLVSSGMITDENKKNVITFDLNSDRIILAPRYNVSFDVFLKFYRIILENFDSEAKFETFKSLMYHD